MSVPQAPDPIPEEMWPGTPNVVLDGGRYAIGWQRFPPKKGGPAYVTARRGVLGGRKVVKRYPLTQDGWERAWAAFERLDLAAAEKTRVALARLIAARAPAGMLAFVPGLVLSAADPPADGFAVGQAYDLSFGEDGLLIARSGSKEATAEYEYAHIAAVQVTGFERVLTMSRAKAVFVRLVFRQPLEDFKENRTYLRVQASDRKLDFWHAAFSPENFRRRLEPVNSAIRQAWLAASARKAEGQPGTEWLIGELSRLAQRHEKGLLTRSDFDLLKARIIGGY